MNQTTVIDAPCGYGKTTYAIQMINSEQDKRFVFCTPYLTEIKLIQHNCRKINGDNRFKEPQPYGCTKLEDFNKLLAAGEDIAVTHCTFLNATTETMELIRKGNYTLILDEALDVIVDFNTAKSVENDIRQSINPADVKALLKQQLISVDDAYRVTWTGGEYDSQYKFGSVARYAELGRLYCVRERVMMIAFPPEVFRCFDAVYVLTYMFSGTVLCHYFNYFGIGYEKASVIQEEDGWHMIPYDPAIDIEFRMKCSRLIHVCDHERLNSLLQTKTALSTNWYDRHSKGEKELLKDLKNAISYFFNRYLCDAKASRGDIMWTCPKEYADKLKGKGYTIQRSMTQIEKELPEVQFKELESRLNCFVPCNARATNKYRKRWALAYCCNIYFNPFLKAFFEACPAGAIDLDEDAYALSCLIQWMFRSRIRDGEPIHIYIPSKRMRHLLNDWMLDNENCPDERTESQPPEGRDGFMTEELCNEENRLTVISTARYNMFRTRSLTTIYDGQPGSSHCQTMNGGL